MKLNRRLQGAAEGLLAVTLIAGAGLVHQAAAQTKTPASQTKKPAAFRSTAKKTPARRVTTRGQAAPTRERIVEIQEALGREGFYAGKPSGKWDADTTQAMKNFQTAKGLTPTGKLGAQSLQKLGLGSEIAGRGAPLPAADARPSALSESDLNEPEPEEPPAN